MKILFIRPNPNFTGQKNPRFSFFEKLFNKMNMFTPSLTFQVLATVIPEEHHIKIVDEHCEKINYNGSYDIVCITTMTHDALRAYEIAHIFRQKGKKVILGGIHASVCPKEAKKHADSVVIGEADEFFPQILEDFDNGHLKAFYQQDNPTDADRIPTPKRNITNRLKLETGVECSRGCPYRCKYCCVGNIPWGKSYRKRPIERVIKEIKTIPQNLIVIYSSSLTIDFNYSKNLFKSLKNVNKKFICLGNTNILEQNEELLRLSKEAGCVQWNIGFESVSQKSLNEVNKNTNKVENYYKIIEKIHDHGMNVHGFFMFGFDNDSKEIFKKTFDFIKKSKIDSADFSILTPFPGTPIHDDFQKQGRILTTDWSKYTYSNIVFLPKNISNSDILKGIKTLYYDFYSFKEIARRFLNSLKRGFDCSKLLIFFVRNILMKIYAKNEIKKIIQFAREKKINI